MPPHRGHQFLVDFASRVTNDLTVVVGSLQSEPICGRLRFQWVKQLYPHLRVVHLTDENPQLPEEHPNFWEIWKRSLEQIAPAPIEFLFASESYGQKLADVLGAEFLPTNSGRSLIPISATEIRECPWKHWKSIPQMVKPYYALHVLLIGGQPERRELIGRSLSSFFEGLFVPEYRIKSGDDSQKQLYQEASEKAGLAQNLPLLVTERAQHSPQTESMHYDLILEVGGSMEPSLKAHRLRGDSKQQTESAQRLIIEGFRGGTKGVITDLTR